MIYQTTAELIDLFQRKITFQQMSDWATQINLMLLF